MLTRVDDEFRDQARRFALRFGCESCIHFDAEGQSCSNGYRTTAHSRLDLDSIRWLLFCKMFELC
jgi:hypothetical protein